MGKMYAGVPSLSLPDFAHPLFLPRFCVLLPKNKSQSVRSTGPGLPFWCLTKLDYLFNFYATQKQFNSWPTLKTHNFYPGQFIGVNISKFAWQQEKPDIGTNCSSRYTWIISPYEMDLGHRASICFACVEINTSIHKVFFRVAWSQNRGNKKVMRIFCLRNPG